MRNPGSSSDGTSVDEDAIFERVPVAYSVVDAATQTIRGNRHFWEMFGFPPEGADAVTVDVITAPEDRAPTSIYLADLIDGRTGEVDIRKTYVRRDGSRFPGHLRATPLRDDDGRIVSLIGVIRDLDAEQPPMPAHPLTPERSSHLGQTRPVGAQPAPLNEEETNRFVSSVVHELRAPLHGIIGLAELLDDSPGLGLTERRLSTAIHDQATALSLLVDDLLDLGKISAGSMTAQLVSTNVGDMLNSVQRMFAADAAAKGLELRTVVEDHVPPVIAIESNRIRRILINLVSNAVRYVETGAVEIRVDVADASRGRARPTAEGEPLSLRLMVTDEGPGIDAALLERIFEPFVQGHSNATGTGLGLAIARQLAVVIGGSLDVESAEGKGAAFTLIAPGRLPQQVTNAPIDLDLDARARPAPASSAERRILVAEDGEVNQMLAVRQLQRLGYQAIVVETGAQAVAAVGASLSSGQPFDAVLMDWYMPEMDGLEATRKIRRLEAAAGIHGARMLPIVGITASAMPGDRERCLDAGMSEFLAKPVGIGRLEDTLAHWIGGRSQRAMIDPAALQQLAEELGGDAIVLSLLKTFRRELGPRCVPIADIINIDSSNQLDVEAAHRAAHTLKSAAALIGAHDFAVACDDLQRRTRDHTLVDPSDAGLTNAAVAIIELSDFLGAEIDDRLRLERVEP